MNIHLMSSERCWASSVQRSEWSPPKLCSSASSSRSSRALSSERRCSTRASNCAKQRSLKARRSASMFQTYGAAPPWLRFDHSNRPIGFVQHKDLPSRREVESQIRALSGRFALRHVLLLNDLKELARHRTGRGHEEHPADRVLPPI